MDTEIKGRASLEQRTQRFAGADAHFHLLRRGWRRDGRQLTRSSGWSVHERPGRPGRPGRLRLHLLQKKKKRRKNANEHQPKQPPAQQTHTFVRMLLRESLRWNPSRSSCCTSPFPSHRLFRGAAAMKGSGSYLALNKQPHMLDSDRADCG